MSLIWLIIKSIKLIKKFKIKTKIKVKAIRILVQVGEIGSMRKRDILTPIGITIGFIMIMLAIVSNEGQDGLSIFIDIAAIFIVIGGLIGSLFINFKFEQIKSVTKVKIGRAHV